MIRSKWNSEAGPVTGRANLARQQTPVSKLGYPVATSLETGGMRYWRRTAPQIPLRGSTLSNATTVAVECFHRSGNQDSGGRNPVYGLLVGPLQLSGHAGLVSQERVNNEESPLGWVAPVSWSHPLLAVAEALLNTHSYRPLIYISRWMPGIPRPDANNRFPSKQITPGGPIAQQSVCTGLRTSRDGVCKGSELWELLHLTSYPHEPEVLP